MTVTDLAARLNIDRTNVSRLCKKLEQDGELARREHPEDRRARHLVLTAKGEELASAVDTASATHFTHILEEVDGDVDAIIAALDQLTQAMQRTNPSEST